ncbi:MAG: hypothetical protein AB1384_14720 [Actinomycetota bacterium]
MARGDGGESSHETGVGERPDGACRRVGGRRAATLLVALVLAAAPAAGCGGGEGAQGPPREQSMRITFEGSYQVKGTDDGVVQGVGIYSNGSFRLILEDTSRMVIYNDGSGEGWLVSLSRRTYEPLSRDEALLKAGFMPGLVMEPYFELEQFWSGPEFRMDTSDGRSVKAYLDGPQYLPGSWLAEGERGTLKEIRWEYRRVGQVSAANFQPPEGFAATE